MLMNSIKLFFILFSITTLISVSKVSAQDKMQSQKSDSTETEIIVDSSVVTYYYDKSAFSKDEVMVIDTTLNFFQRYDYLHKDYDIMANTMIIGGPHKNLSFSSAPIPLFSIGDNNLRAYLITPDNIKHYNAPNPYSEVYYTSGSQEFNLLKVTLGSQFSERLYFGLDFNTESTLGLFTNQRAQSNQFQMNSSFVTLNKRYGLYVNYIRNKFKFGENGGLTNDYYYEDSAIVNRQILSVNLNHATNSITSNYYEFDQHILLGGLPGDTLDKAKFGKIFLKSNISINSRLYEDQDTSFYDNYYLDTLASHDSIHTKVLNAALGWTNDIADPNQHIGVNAQLNYQYSEYFNGNKTFFFNYLSPQLNLFVRTKIFDLELAGKYKTKLGSTPTLNIGDGDLFFNGDIAFNIDKMQIKAGLDFYNVSPEIKTQNFYSNHFMWDKILSKQTSLNINGGIKYRGYNLSSEFITVNDYVYFNEKVQPQKFSGSIGLIKIRFQKQFTFKKFGATALALYQSSSNTSIIRVPALTARTSIYFSFPLFKGALIIHPGFDITYLTSYYGDTYNPSLMAFHIQNDKKLDDQVYANFYVNFKIKRARVFVSYEHFNTLWGKYNYFLVTHYPQEDANLKFGISWRFYK